MTPLCKALLIELAQHLPDLRVREHQAGTGLVFDAPNVGLGEIAIVDDGDEATVHIGNLTHAHFNPYDDRVDVHNRMHWIPREVVDFVTDLVADRIVVWTAANGRRGGWYSIGRAVGTVPSDAVSHLWSRALP